MTRNVRAVVLAGASTLLMPMPTHVARLDAQEGATGATAQAAGVVPASPPTSIDAGVPKQDFDTWAQGVRAQALQRGISEPTVTAAFANLQPLPVVVERDRSQAELVLSLDEYLQRRLTRKFIRAGREMAAKHRSLLQRVASDYDVQSKYLVAIWGVESNYGRFQGVRPTIQALATLAWEGRRGPFFLGELFNALEIVDRGYIALPQLQGSWAGAMGQTQFMPSSYLKYAQDYDRDGNRDIWHSEGDIFASVANYLKSYGWVGGETWGREVRLPKGGALSVIDKVGLRTSGCRAEREMTARAPLSRWKAVGVRALDGGPLPAVERNASLVHNGNRTFLVYGNYEALLGYNCAHTYALSVALLADRIGS
ncbi:MAG TPA: lytic murein transglycosylase [Vicinamibacterales bacterium]|nr:lytic murein transglycosylase [Vicinamibacterales bacterium]